MHLSKREQRSEMSASALATDYYVLWVTAVPDGV